MRIVRDVEDKFAGIVELLNFKASWVPCFSESLLHGVVVEVVASGMQSFQGKGGVVGLVSAGDTERIAQERSGDPSEWSLRLIGLSLIHI